MANYGCACNGNVAGTNDTGCSYNCNCQNGDPGTVGGPSTCNGCCNGGCNIGMVGGVTGCNSCNPCNQSCGGDTTCNSETWLVIIAIVLLILALFSAS